MPMEELSELPFANCGVCGSFANKENKRIKEEESNVFSGNKNEKLSIVNNKLLTINNRIFPPFSDIYI